MRHSALSLMLWALVAVAPRPAAAQSTWQKIRASAARADSVRRARADSAAAARAAAPAPASSSDIQEYHAQDIQEYHAQEVKPAAPARDVHADAPAPAVRPAPDAATAHQAPAAPAASTPSHAASSHSSSSHAARAPDFVGTYFSWGVVNTKLLILPNGTWETAQSEGHWRSGGGRMIILDGNARGWCGGKGILNDDETQLSFDCVSEDGFPMNVTFAKHSRSIER